MSTYLGFWHLAQKYTLSGRKKRKVLTNQLRCSWKWNDEPHLRQYLTVAGLKITGEICSTYFKL